MSVHDPSRSAAASAGRLVLALLVTADVLLIGLFLVNVNISENPKPWLNLSNDDGWAEAFVHVKQLWVVMLLVVLWMVRRESVLLGWLAVAVFYGIDDWFHLHETMGQRLADVGPTVPFVGRHANHVYEMVWLGSWGLVIGAVVLMLHRASGPSARSLSVRLGKVFGLLVLVGVVLDAAHVAVEDIQYVNGIFVIGEESGEHLLMSFLIAMLISCVALDRWPGREGRWLLPPDARPRPSTGTHVAS